MLTDEQRAEIRARAEAVTEGPWGRAVVDEPTGAYDVVASPAGDVARFPNMRGYDAEFIAHARQDVPALLDALEAERALSDRLAGALVVLADYAGHLFEQKAPAGCGACAALRDYAATRKGEAT